MRTFIINLASAEARRETIARAMTAADIAWEFFRAITPADDPLRLFAGIDTWTFLLETGRTKPSPAELACYASHLLLWRKCIELDAAIVVLEDDVEPTSAIGEVYTELEQLTHAYGFIRLEPATERPNYFPQRAPADAQPVLVAQTGSLRVLHPTYMSLCTGAYAVSPAAAKRLLAASRQFCCPVDNFLRRTWVHRQQMFYLEPPPYRLAAGSADSQISERHAGRPESMLLRKFRRLPKRPYHCWARFASRREGARVRRQLGWLQNCRSSMTIPTQPEFLQQRKR